MQVKQVSLNNFRNYSQTAVNLTPGKTILIGQNAQGKSNFLEAIEIASFGKSNRAGQESELIRWGQQNMQLKVDFERQGAEESIAVAFKPGAAGLANSFKRQYSLNGVTQGSFKDAAGRLVAVMFTSQDLNLLRGGPKFRRDWIDNVALRLRPGFQDTLSSYAKTISQRNRLLKALFERGKVTVTDQDQLLAWDKQLARFGCRIIKQRTTLLEDLLPLAAEHQEHISGQRETLEAQYIFRCAQTSEDLTDMPEEPAPAFATSKLSQLEEAEIGQHLLRLLKERRAEEIGRKQTLIGPHRDDITFTLNQSSATTFASQGQQRSLVLSLKLAELDRICTSLDEPPVLLLDDVLAELDMSRQGLLMSAVRPDMQTVITTTHVSGFQPAWLSGATILSVDGGNISLVSA